MARLEARRSHSRQEQAKQALDQAPPANQRNHHRQSAAGPDIVGQDHRQTHRDQNQTNCATKLPQRDSTAAKTSTLSPADVSSSPAKQESSSTPATRSTDVVRKVMAPLLFLKNPLYTRVCKVPSIFFRTFPVIFLPRCHPYPPNPRCRNSLKTRAPASDWTGHPY